MELIRAHEVATFSNSGVTSRQLLIPENSRSERVTITLVSVSPGAVNPRHRHETSEQVWVALRGTGRLLLEDGKTTPFAEGDVARFEENDPHGLENTSDSEFEYLSDLNTQAFAQAEALGWREPGKGYDEEYLRRVNQAAGRVQ